MEGLPGSGKSTTAHFTCLHLFRHGRDARWCHEEEVPHPIFDYETIRDAFDHGRLDPSLFEVARANWSALASDVAASGRSTVLDGSLLQTPIHPMLLLDWDRDRIVTYVIEVALSLAPAHPLLVMLRDDDVGSRLKRTIEARGSWMLEVLEARILGSPFARARGFAGLEGVTSYFEAFRDLTDAIIGRLPIESLVLALDQLPADRVNERVAAALGLPPFQPFETRVDDLSALVGRYERIGHPEAYEIGTDGTHLYTGSAPKSRLIHRGALRFEIASLPVGFEFLADGDGRIRALECQGRMPDLPYECVKS